MAASASMSVPTTVAPSAANNSEAACPIPPPVPEINATLPSRRPVIVTPLLQPRCPRLGPVSPELTTQAPRRRADSCHETGYCQQITDDDGGDLQVREWDVAVEGPIGLGE